MRVLKVTQPGKAGTSPIALRCPGCRHQATFQPLADIADFRVQGHIHAGQRVCSTPGCKTHVFVVHENGELVEAYPPERLDFDPVGIPDAIRASFEEALTGHANACYRSAAMMLRRTLEELCQERGIAGEDPASGKPVSLKDRLDALKTAVVLPKDLFEALHDLRLLGNDAAHVVSKDYDDVGQEEVEVGVDLVKEILKAVYQLRSLVERLRGLKRQDST